MHHRVTSRLHWTARNLAVVAVGVAALAGVTSPARAMCAPALDHEVRLLNQPSSVRLCEEYQGQVLLVVNTASRCGYTPQYKGLESLWRTYGGEGLVVLGFPSNDFGSQEPGSEAEIKNFCELDYGVSFPMFEKVALLRGPPLFQGSGPGIRTESGLEFP
jgi:glutathione peroxidase